jgi:hypothetical protein
MGEQAEGGSVKPDPLSDKERAEMLSRQGHAERTGHEVTLVGDEWTCIECEEWWNEEDAE